MTIRTHRAPWLLAVLLATVAVTGACRRDYADAKSDFTMKLTTNPTTIALNGETSGTADVIATVLDKNGFPQGGINVSFVTDTGTLASGGSVVQTGANGQAHDTLTTGADSNLTATSGTLSATAKVTVTP